MGQKRDPNYKIGTNGVPYKVYWDNGKQSSKTGQSRKNRTYSHPNLRVTNNHLKTVATNFQNHQKL